MITGQEKPDAGEIQRRRSVKLAYVEQSRDVLQAEETIWQAISDGQEMHQARQRCRSTAAPTSAEFGFTGTDQQKKVGVLSGGERNRVHLARMLKQGANVAAARRADQ